MNKGHDPNVEPSSVRLVERAARGELAAQRELFETHREAAFAVAVRITGRHADALDVVQDAFIRAFGRLSEFQQESEFKTWLLRIVTNRALDLLRARRVRLAVSLDGDSEDGGRAMHTPADDDAAPPDAGLERDELRERLQQAVAKLPPEQQSVFALYATGDMTYEQIAEAVGIPIGTVMSRLYHARRRLHELLADLAPPEVRR